MSWFYLALAAAVFQAASDVVGKKITNESDEYVFALAIFAAPALILLPLCLSTGMPQIGPSYWGTFAIVCIFEVIGVLLFAKAIARCDLSIALPLQMVTPVVLLLSSPLLLGESPSVLGLSGVIMILLGSYLLNIHSFSQGVLEPFTKLVSHQGARYMLAAACLWGVTCSLHKICVVESSPLFYASSKQFICSILISIYLLLRKPKTFTKAGGQLPKIFVLGAVSSMIALCTFSAMTSGLAIYVIAVKRASVLFGVILGCYLFKEFGLRQRFAGATLMTAGALLTNF